MAKNVYGTGLKNVGSYQVSGKPFVTASTVSDGTEQQIEFPEVTNNITVKLDSATGGGTSDYTMHNSWYTSGSHTAVTGALAMDGSDLTATSSVSFSWWGKPVAAGGGASVTTLMGFGKSWNGEDNILAQSKTSATVSWINADGDISWWGNAMLPAGYSDFDSEGFANDWFHYAFTLESNAAGAEMTASFYRNGVELVGTNDTRSGAGVVNHDLFGAGIYRSFHIGGFNPEVYHHYRDVILWDGVLSPTQVNSLYQASASYSSSAFSPAGLEKVCWFKPTGSVQEVDFAAASANPLFKNFGNASDGFIIRMGNDAAAGNYKLKIAMDSPFPTNISSPTALKMEGQEFYYINSDTSNTAVNGESRSLSIWVSASAATVGPDNTILISGTSTSGVDHFSIIVIGTDWSARHKDYGAGAAISTAINEGWQHLVLTTMPSDANGTKLYKNGVEVGSSATAQTHGSRLGGGMRLGPWYATGGDALYEIKDAILWNDALTGTEVENLYLAGSDTSHMGFTPIGKDMLVWVRPDVNVGDDTTTLKNLANSSSYGDLTLTDAGAGDSATLVSTVSKSGYLFNGEFRLKKSGTYALGTDETYVFWMKTQNTTNSNNHYLFHIGTDVQIQYKPSTQTMRVYVNTDGGFINSGALVVDLKSNTHLVLSINHDDKVLFYVNNVLLWNGDLTTNNAITGNTDIFVGSFSQDYDIGYIEIARFTTAFDSSDINEAYNGGKYFNLRNHTEKNNLENYWLFGDGTGDIFNNNGNSAKLTATIVDQVGSLDLEIDAAQADNDDEIKQFQTPYNSSTLSSGGGELRIHYRSTGSSNVATNKHYWTLDGQNEEISMNIKSKEIYLSADGGDCDYSLQADLTNIPSSRMYQHTGSGVDE